LKRAENLPAEELDGQGNRVERKSNKGHKRDGNRAVILCSTTDPYQTISVENDDGRKVILQALRGTLVRKALELILEHSTINVRILTRSPLAKKDFDLYKEFGPRLLFGMSLPTLDDNIRKLYEPKAPGVQARLRVLEEAKAAGLHVYIAMAPTSPECKEDDLRATLTKIKELKPLTIFHEPINLRAENVARIAKHAEELKVVFNQRPLLKENWAAYALWQLKMVESIATELGLEKQLHLWPDKSLGRRNVWTQARRTMNQPATDQKFTEHLKWLERWWKRISEWPKNPEIK
jgi:DNA repair photolyase